MKTCFPACFIALGLAAPVMAADMPLERTVQGNTVISNRDPQVHIDVPPSATFVGTDTWMLQSYWDDIMLYAFVDAGAQRQVQRLYWVQFEAYLPSHPEEHHHYDSTRHVTLGGMDFLVDTWTESPGSQKDVPDSDDAHLHGLLTAKGYSLPASMMTVRFVHLMDGGRKELMFIYSEPTPAGLIAGDLKKSGKAYGQWAELEKGLIERGEKSFELH